MPRPEPSAPTVDVIIPNYNYADFVGEAIKSSLTQDPPFDSVVVVDDGSTDGSLDVIERYADRITIVRKANGGQLSACIAGLRVCDAEYVCFLDSDDVLLPTASRQIRAGIGGRPVKAQFQLVGIDGDGKPLESRFPIFPYDYDAPAMVADNLVQGYYISPPTSGNVFARELLEAWDLSALDQKDFIDGVPNLLAPHFGDVLSIDSPISGYRLHGNNFSKWGGPTTESLLREIEWLSKRWKQAHDLTGGAVEIPNLESSLYVLERRLMIAALDPGGDVRNASRRYLDRLSGVERPGLTGRGLRIWARLLGSSPPGLRRRLVLARRSPENRSRAANLAILAIKRANAGIARLRRQLSHTSS